MAAVLNELGVHLAVYGNHDFGKYQIGRTCHDMRKKCHLIPCRIFGPFLYVADVGKMLNYRDLKKNGVKYTVICYQYVG